MTALGTVLSGLLSGATGEAGAQAIEALRQLLRRAPQDDDGGNSTDVERLLSNSPPNAARAVAEYLANSANADPAFGRDLQQWLNDAQAIVGDVSVVNSVTGTVNGPVIQAGVIKTDSITQK